jgi:hypothetical protein
MFVQFKKLEKKLSKHKENGRIHYILDEGYIVLPTAWIFPQI